jgi:hypothetical protein
MVHFAVIHCFPRRAREILDVFIIVTFILHFFSRLTFFLEFPLRSHKALYTVLRTLLLISSTSLSSAIVPQWRVWDRSVGVRCQKLYKQQHFINIKMTWFAHELFLTATVRLSARNFAERCAYGFQIPIRIFYFSIYSTYIVLLLLTHRVIKKKVWIRAPVSSLNLIFNDLFNTIFVFLNILCAYRFGINTCAERFLDTEF